jgi:uncharacterized protein YegL
MSTTTENKSTSDNDIDYDFDFGNYNPEDVDQEDTINAVFAIDVSGSVSGYVDELNDGINEFVTEMQKSHVADKIFTSIVKFNSNVEVETGFQPIKNLSNNIDFEPSIGGMTALFEGTNVALTNALDYREGLENAGVNCKTLLFVITDGHDNVSNCTPADVKKKIDDLMMEERNFASFEAILFGIGMSNKTKFEEAAKDMGIKHVATISDSAQDIRKMIAFISSSVSQSSGSGNAISTPNF